MKHAGQSIGFDCTAGNGTLARSVGCYGKTGDQVLDSIGLLFPGMSSENTLAMDCGVMIAIGAFFKLGYVVLLLLKVRKVATPKDAPPAALTPPAPADEPAENAAAEKPVSFSELEQDVKTL